MKFRIPTLITIAGCMLVVGCEKSETPQQQMADLQQTAAKQKYDDDLEATRYTGKAILVATAPDGTKLWGTQPPDEYHPVFFSSKGTETTVPEGKSTRIVVTPGVSQ